jgi:hypothetical protein
MKCFRLASEVRLKRSAEGLHAYELATTKFSNEKTEIRDTGRGVGVRRNRENLQDSDLVYRT